MRAFITFFWKKPYLLAFQQFFWNIEHSAMEAFFWIIVDPRKKVKTN